METSRLKPPQPDGCVQQGRGTNTGYLGTRSCSSRGEQKGYFPRRASQKLKALCVCVCFSILLLLGKNKGVFLLGDVCAGGHAEGKASVSPQSTPGCCRCLEPPPSFGSSNPIPVAPGYGELPCPDRSHLLATTLCKPSSPATQHEGLKTSWIPAWEGHGNQKPPTRSQEATPGWKTALGLQTPFCFDKERA